jgi:hypothetical protein
MSLNIKGNQIASGKLSYKFFEKDKNEGTLVGEIKGDTLFADYLLCPREFRQFEKLLF